MRKNRNPILMMNKKLLSVTQDRYLAAAIMGEANLARSVIHEAIELGARPTEIYIDVLAPSQAKLGELWHQGTINIAQEHLATSITMQIMEQQRNATQPQEPLGLRALVTPVEGDQHFVGARMIADALLSDGWDVEFFWNATPAEDVAEYVQQRRIDLLAISITMTEHLPNVKRVTEAIKKLDSHRPHILLGGAAMANLDPPPQRWGADTVADNLIDAIKVVRNLVGINGHKPSLEEHLISMGQVIKEARSRRNLTQQQLADTAGLDRTYISMVEHGKQNLTIGAILKIADALDIHIGQLIDPV